MIVLIVSGFAIMLWVVGQVAGEECTQINSWNIDEYEIREYRCLGWAGPYHYPLYLYKDGKRVSNGVKLDSCTMRFKPQNDLCLKLNICSNTVNEIRPHKKTIDLSQVDSVVMINLELDRSKKLRRADAQIFVQKWNDAPVFDYRDKEVPFYPSSSYAYRVYLMGDSIRNFETGNFMIKDEDHWTYSFLESREKTSTKKFDEIWNELNDN